MDQLLTAAEPKISRKAPLAFRTETTLRYDPHCRLLPQLSADAISNIPGVFDTQVNSLRKTIRIVFDGLPETVRRLGEYLNSCQRNSRYCGHSCPQPAHPSRTELPAGCTNRVTQTRFQK